jgi:PKD repeat protein
MKKINIVLNLKYSIVLFFLFVTTILKAQPPTAAFSFANQICLGDEQSYGDASTGAPDTWSWYFQGGMPDTSYVQYPGTVLYENPGTYEVRLIVSNVYGADTITDYLTIFENPSLSYTITDILCYGDSTGSIEANASGGIMPYFYSWSTGGFNAIENNLPAGTYTVTVSDVNNCQATAYPVLNEPEALSATLTTTDVSCNGMADGSISVSVTGGELFYNYGWSSGSGNTPTPTGLATGSYTVTIEDGNGCILEESATITEPSLINVSFSTIDVTCNGMNDGSISTTVTGGVSPYDYLWSPGGENTPTITDLIALNYTLTVTDANNCQAIDNVTINEPSPITIALSDESICPGDTGSLTAFPSGGTLPYTYSWNDPLLTTTNVMTDFPTVTTNYEVTVTDANGCTDIANADLIISSPIVNIYDTTICEGGTISLAPSISGGTAPFNYNWLPGGETTQTLIDSPVDTTVYSLSVMDANGCSANDNATVTVNPNPIANATFMSLCEDTLGQSEFDLTALNNSVNGGTGNTVSWYQDPGLTQYISGASAYVTGSTTLYVDVESPELCHSYASVQLVVKDSTTNVIKGTVNFQGSPITNGNVRLIRKNGNLPQEMELVQVKPVNGMGEYTFNDIPKGAYIVKAFGDTSLYDCIPTYSGDVFDWASAMEYSIVATCDDTISIGIELIVEPNNSGLGSISGRLIEDDGTTNKAPGDPIGDIDITVEQSPGGAVMSGTSTDVGGYFSFHGLAAGDYIIYADMLGYTTTPQVISFDGSNMNQDVILCSNDTLTTVDLCSNVVTSISIQSNNSSQFNIYPNPASDKLTISFNGEEKIEISIIDMQGREVFKKDNVKNHSVLNVSYLSNGVYQLKLIGTNFYSIQKILIQR